MMEKRRNPICFATHSSYNNGRILYVIVTHCLKYFTTCTVFTVVLVIFVYLTRLVAKSVPNDVMICSGTLQITDHFLIEAPQFGILYNSADVAENLFPASVTGPHFTLSRDSYFYCSSSSIKRRSLALGFVTSSL